jgi:hypothetical protein
LPQAAIHNRDDGLQIAAHRGVTHSASATRNHASQKITRRKNDVVKERRGQRLSPPKRKGKCRRQKD